MKSFLQQPVEKEDEPKSKERVTKSRLGPLNPNFIKNKEGKQQKKQPMVDAKTQPNEGTVDESEEETKTDNLFFIPLEKEYNLPPLVPSSEIAGPVCKRTARGYTK